MCPRSATLYVDTHALPTHLFDNAKVRLRSAINILAMTRLLDEKEEPGGTLAYINGALLSLLSDALSEIEAGHPSLPSPARRPGLAGGFVASPITRPFALERRGSPPVPVLAKRPPIARSFRPFFGRFLTPL